eukprot:CAMPEP_0119505786 /NCGR_PEP_ID=MMETSP1344-20130328/26240_1 /TAXON_ID=236787 /ORGANISM="Florenciella parvula, Strain CCMP2471" /LENGTH=36 /DNA_ID= /DNA_START= /DNA_END= /DNA_ORIENTATION=
MCSTGLAAICLSFMYPDCTRIPPTVITTGASGCVAP